MITEATLSQKHKGKLGFVLGAGPSLRHVSPATVAPFVTVAVNSAISKFRDADYFLAQDLGATRWDYWRELPSKCICLLNERRLINAHQHIESSRVCLFRSAVQRTGAGSAVRLLNEMGCNPIVLLGCDCSSDGLKRYFWEYEGEKPCKRCDREYLSEGQAHYAEFVSYWDKFAASAKDINIINASGGTLGVFPRMQLAEVLERYGDRK